MDFVIYKVVHYLLRHTVLNKIKLPSAILEKQLDILEMHIQVYFVQIRVNCPKQVSERLQHSCDSLFRRYPVDHLNNCFRNKASQYFADEIVIPCILVCHHLLYLSIVWPVPV